MISRPALRAAALFAAGCGGVACADSSADPAPPAPSDVRVQFDLQPLAPTPYPEDNPRSEAKVELGQLLFFEPILSGERDVSCATCHHPDFGFADGRPRSIGPGGEGLGPDRRAGISAVSGEPIAEMARNAPTVLNAALAGRETGDPDARSFQFWDGRALGLEDQALLPIAARDEMRGDAYSEDVALDSVVARLRAIPAYEARFEAAFPGEAGAGDSAGPAIDAERIAMALATYQRELVTRASRFDRYVAGDDDALTETELRGLDLFFDRAACTQCHSGPAFSHFRFEVTGVPPEGPGGTRISGDDTGREEHTGLAEDRYAFRTPSLRNVELTAPYMHDGVFATLEEVVEFYDAGGRPRHPAIDDDTVAPQIPRPLGLTVSDREALVAFLRTLTDPGSELDPELLHVPAEVPSGLPTAAGAPRGLAPDLGAPPSGNFRPGR